MDHWENHPFLLVDVVRLMWSQLSFKPSLRATNEALNLVFASSACLCTGCEVLFSCYTTVCRLYRKAEVVKASYVQRFFPPGTSLSIIAEWCAHIPHEVLRFLACRGKLICPVIHGRLSPNECWEPWSCLDGACSMNPTQHCAMAVLWRGLV